MNALSIEEVNDNEKFNSLKDEWDTLLQESPDNNIFLTWEWLFTWWQHYGGEKKLRIVLIKDNGKIIGIAPLMQSKITKGLFSVNVLENLCSQNCDYSGIILTKRQDESVNVFLDYLKEVIKKGNLIVRIWHIPETTRFLASLHEQFPHFSKSISLNQEVSCSCPYIELPPTWEEYSHNLTAHSRHNLRRSFNLLQKNYHVQFKKYCGDGDFGDLMEDLFRFHKNRWQEWNINSKFISQTMQEFYLDVSKRLYQNNWLALSFMTLDDKPAAIHWGFVYNNVFYLMTPTFDVNYSHFSVGKIHTMKMIQDAIQTGLREFDFLKGIEIYKAKWTHHKRDNVQITIAKRGIVGTYRVILLNMIPKIHLIGPASIKERIIKYLKRGMKKPDNQWTSENANMVT